MRINYEDPEVVARQNIAPNAGCDIDGVFYDMRNCVHLLNEQADRIEELKAKLAKAVEIALEECPFGYGTRKARDWWRNQRATLAELKVGDRG